jgi:phosphatidylserine/phosphatidylglycerophosphate/cardiolipin synthase-like enzyme
MDEPAIEDALQSASRRGVDVEVLMSMQTSWLTAFRALTASGVKIRTYDSKALIYIHAKAIIVDDMKAFVGSENFSGPSLDDNRELGIIFSKPDIISSIQKTFESDWAGATVFQ